MDKGGFFVHKVKMFFEGKVDVEKIANIELSGDFGTYKNVIATKWGVLTILMYEEFFFRIGSDLSVTIIADERAKGTTLELIAAGGHALGDATFGSEKAALKDLIKRFEGVGFEVKEETKSSKTSLL